MATNTHKVQWMIPGTSRCPPGPDYHGEGYPITQEVAEVIAMKYSTDSDATHGTPRNFKTLPVGMKHYAVLSSSPLQANLPLESPVPEIQEISRNLGIPGISLQGLMEITQMLGGRDAVQGKTMQQVFELYAELTVHQDPRTPLTRAVRAMLGLPN